MVMKSSDLATLYLITKNTCDEQIEQGTFEPAALRAAVTMHARNHYNITHGARIPQTLSNNINKVVDMYLELMAPAAVAYPEVEALPLPRYEPSYLDQLVHRPLFSYTDRSWNTYNTTNNYGTQSSKEKKNQTLEETLLQIGITIGAGIVGAIALVSFGYLAAEMANHISRIYHNEGTVEGFMLLTGMGLSYCLAALTLYEIAGGVLLASMAAAAFVNPAAWAAAFIVLGAVIATPVFNMVIREGIYSLFSMFDNQALVKEDHRFRGLTQAEEDSLPSYIDPDRVNFATLCKYDELKPTQKRTQFAFFDYNSKEMSEVLHDVREMRHSHAVNVEKQGCGLFSLRHAKITTAPRSTPVAVAVAVDEMNTKSFAPSAPPADQMY